MGVFIKPAVIVVMLGSSCANPWVRNTLTAVTTAWERREVGSLRQDTALARCA